MIGRIAGAGIASFVALSASATPPPATLHGSARAARFESAAPHAAAASQSSGVPGLLSATSAAADGDRSDARLTTLAHDVTVDLGAGAISGETDITLIAGAAPLETFSLVFDEGIEVTGATAFERVVGIGAVADGVSRRFELTLSPPLAAGRLASVRIAYAGRPSCRADARRACRLSPELGYLGAGTGFPEVVAPRFDASELEQILVVRRPSSVGAVASGDVLGETNDGVTAVTHFFTPGYATEGQLVLVLGDLAEVDLPDRGQPPSTLRYVARDPAWTDEIGTWLDAILPSYAERTGLELPFSSLSVVKLPAGEALSSAAGHGLVLLSEGYAERGPRAFEEALAHQCAHLYYGTLVAPAEAERTALLTEGIATLAALDYMALRHAPWTRDAYLERRFREHQLLLRYARGARLPPLVVARTSELPSSRAARMLWAYIKSSATLDHLRVAIGEASFDSALRRHVGECARRFCTVDDFRRLLEAESGQELAGFFEQWVRGSAAESIRVRFDQLAPGRIRVHLDGHGALEVPLELWIELEDGQLARRRIRASRDRSSIDLEVPGPVRAVRPNPRHDAVLDSRSSVAGDVDFDLEVDGIDLAACARGFGRRADVEGASNEGFFGLDLDFDPRCDTDGDGSIDEADLAEITARFGTLRREQP
jgi:hypothetical protein